MGKRANNEGSVYQRADGRWCAAYQVNGKRKYVYGQTQSDALAKLRAVQAAIANDTYTEPSRMTVGEWLTFWLAQIAPVGLRASTLNTNRIIIEKTLLPALGDVKLQDKRLADRIQRFINDRSAQGIAPATVRRETAVLTRALNAALDRAGLKHRSVLALRHTFATLWVQSGQDIRTLSEVIGHSSVAFTMQKYVHSDSTTKRQGMELMASFL